MSRTLWRISQYPGLSGLGGMFGDGRWHSKGRPILYTAEHPALALVESMAHLDLTIDQVPDTLKLCRIEVDDSLAVHRRALPAGWQANQLMSRKVGDAWLLAATHALFEVPSAILPHAINVLINPALISTSTPQLVEVSIDDLWIDARFLL